jgi:sugar (pentulose or hexulose) kinase
MGMYSKGIINSWSEISRFTTAEKEFEPDNATTEKYQTHIRIFGHLYEKLKDDFELLSELNQP